MKREALGVIVVVACLMAAVWLMSPRVVTETTTRSGAGDWPPGIHLGPFPGQTPVPTYRPYDPMH